MKNDFVRESFHYYMIKGAQRLACMFPITWSLAVARVFGLVTYRLHKGRRIGYVNLKAAFGPSMPACKRRRTVRDMYINLAQTVAEVFYFPKMDLDYIYRYVDSPHFDRLGQALRKGRGAIFLTAHIGNWELENVAASIRGISMIPLVKEQKNEKLSEFLNFLRESHGSTVSRRGIGLRQIVKALHENAAIGYVSDQSGGPQGLWVDFFGRKANFATGAFALARRTGACVLPCFQPRLRGPYHRLDIDDPMRLVKTDDKDSDIRKNTEQYVRLLEERIRSYPEQWLWAHKRWKATRTKHVVVLKDGKAGHESQSLAVLGLLKRLEDSANPPYEFKENEISVSFKGKWRKKLLPIFAVLFYPFAQSRLSWLRWFFEASSAQAIEDTYADIVISCGSSLLGLNLLMARENMAKKVVLMKPSFPFNLFSYELAVIPEHDRPTNVKRSLFISTSPNRVVKEMLAAEGARLESDLKCKVRPAITFFVGGNTRRYSLEKRTVNRALDQLFDAAASANSDILVTTSRRTPAEIDLILKDRLRLAECCKLLVVANEKNIDNVTYGMMGLSDYLVVTEDSISMISEAISSGKKVVILRQEVAGLPHKHKAFQENLAKKGLACLSYPWQLKETILRLGKAPVLSEASRDEELITQRLKELL